jgi:hypothetical protein
MDEQKDIYKQTCRRLYPIQFKYHAECLPHLPVVLSQRIRSFEKAEDIHLDRISVDICKTILGYTKAKDQHMTWHETKNEMLDAYVHKDVEMYITEYVIKNNS